MLPRNGLMNARWSRKFLGIMTWLVGEDMNVANRTLVIMAKAPVPGTVKTRLCPPLEPETAAEFHSCCVLDAVEKSRLLARTRVVLAYAPAGALPTFEQIAAHVDFCLAQEGSDLGERMLGCFTRLCEPGSSVLLVGTDTPTLPAGIMERAFVALESEEANVVFGPAT